MYKLNYKNNLHNKDAEKMILNAKGKLIVIDNADIILTNELRKHIALDNENQYLIIGRNPANLFATRDNLFELSVSNTEEHTLFHIKPYF